MSKCANLLCIVKLDVLRVHNHNNQIERDAQSLEAVRYYKSITVKRTHTHTFPNRENAHELYTAAIHEHCKLRAADEQPHKYQQKYRYDVAQEMQPIHSRFSV